jgi:uncharacterized protein YlxW (UPF0749 family)
MNNALPIVAVVATLFTLAIVLTLRRKRKRTPIERLRLSIEDSLDDAQQQAQALHKRARKLRGDAKKRLETQAHEVEDWQKDLRGRLEVLRSDAGKLLERARG